MKTGLPFDRARRFGLAVAGMVAAIGLALSVSKEVRAQGERVKEIFRSPGLTAAVSRADLDEASYSVGKFVFTQMTDLWGHDRFKGHAHLLPSICLQERQFLLVLHEFQTTSQANLERALQKGDQSWVRMQTARRRLVEAAHHRTQEAANEAARQDTSEARVAFHRAMQAFEDSEIGIELRQAFVSAKNAFDSSSAGEDHILVRSMEPALRLARRRHAERCDSAVSTAGEKDITSAQASLSKITNAQDFSLGWLAGLATSGLVYQHSSRAIRDQDAERLEQQMRPAPVRRYGDEAD